MADLKTAYQFEAGSAKTAARHILELREQLRILKLANNDVQKATDQYGFSLTKTTRIARELYGRELLGLKHSTTSLFAAEKQHIQQLQTYQAELKNTSGVMGMLNQIAGKMGINFSSLAQPVMLITGIVLGLAAATGKAVVEFAKFAVETIKMANAEAQARAAFQAMTGSIEEGNAAYKEWDERVKNSNLPRSIYDVKEAAAAYNKDLMPALLDAEEAFNGTAMSAAAFMTQLTRMKAGDAPMRRGMFEYIGVLNEAGLSIDEVTSKTADHRAQVTLIEAALARMAQRQREAAGETVAGSINEIKNQWHEYKEELGAVLNKGLGPIVAEGKKLFIEFLKTGNVVALFKQLADLLTKNKDEIISILQSVIGITNALIDGTSAVVEFADKWYLVKGAVYAVSGVLEVIRGIVAFLVWDAEKFLETITLGVVKARSLADIYKGPGRGGVGVTPGTGPDYAAIAASTTPEQRRAEMEKRGYTPAQIKAAERRLKTLSTGREYPEGEGGEGGAGDRVSSLKERYKKTFAQAKPIITQTMTPGQVLGGQTESEASVAEAERQKKDLEFAKELAETINPAQAIMEGLKSGDMKTAVQDFAVNLGEAVASELMKAMIMAGILAILNAMSGGGSGALQGALGLARGGVIKAAGGFTGTLSPRPGGWMFPWGNFMINAAEAGRPETLAVIPEGAAGRQLIMRDLLPQFFPEMTNVNENHFSPKVTVIASGTDDRAIHASVRSEQGKANRVGIQRSAVK